MPIPGGPRPTDAPAHLLSQVAAWAGGVVPPGGGGIRVSGVTLSSRAVRPGDLYAALPGARAHGADFTAQAAQAGAAAVLTDGAGAARAASTGLPVIVVPDPRGVLGGLAAQVYGCPASALLMLGVTGTNGKTTTTFLLDAALRAAGHTTGMIGTVEIRVGHERVPATGTTPEAPDLHALLAVMLERGVGTCAMEISSHALAQHRVDGLTLDVAAFTNLSQDHLDYHPTMEEYFAAKAQLFTPQRARRAVICVDDAWGRRLAGAAGVPVQTVSSRPRASGPGAGDGPPADWQVVQYAVVDGHPQARVSGPDGVSVTLRSPLPGAFNLANGLVALAVLVSTGMPVDTAAAAITVGPAVPGRMERVTASAPGATGTGSIGGTEGTGSTGSPGGEPLAVVDYAHSPDAVRNALGALQDGGRPLVVVLGAGGDRDREKRPLMGEAAAEAADVVIVTDDNPRSEDPAAIRAQVLAGTRGHRAQVVEIADRRSAMVEGARLAWGGGVLLVAGKGHEPGQEVAGRVLPFDDRDVLRQALLEVARTGVEVPARTPTDVEGTIS